MLIGASLVTISGGPVKADASCGGLTATITGEGEIIGTPGPDVIVGSDGPDIITGLAGGDIICGLGGDDIIEGGPGSPDGLGDQIFPGPGDDVAYGDSVHADDADVDVIAFDGADAGVNVDLAAGTATGQGSDTIHGFAGVRGTGHDDRILGDQQANEITSFAGDDYIDGREGPDVIKAGLGNDRVNGGPGNDELYGGPDDDILSGYSGNDRLDGGSNDVAPADNDACAQGRGQGPTLNCESKKLPLDVEDVSVNEGECACFVVSLPVPTDFSVRFTARTSNDTARYRVDYQTRSGGFFIPPGQTATIVDVATVHDWELEPDETFNLALSNVQGGAALTRPRVTATIKDTTLPLGLIAGDVSVSEGNVGLLSAKFPLFAGTPAKGVSVLISTGETGTATPGEDFVVKSPTKIAWSGPNPNAVGSVSIIGDTEPEADETIVVILTDPSGAPIVDGEGTITIIDDDTIPTLQVDDVSITEANTTTYVTFDVTLDRPFGKLVRIKYKTTPGTATAADFTQVPLRTMTFKPGQTQMTVRVAVKGDRKAEDDEVFSLDFSAPLNVLVPDPSATATIVDND